jgi:hypothetical protein
MMETVEADNVTVEALAVMVTGVQDVADNITLGDEVVIARVVAGELDVVAMHVHADEYLEVP